MPSCSVCKGMEIVPGGMADYKKLAGYHYRGDRFGPFAAIFALRPSGRIAWRADTDTVGVIVYTMPPPQLELRNVATGGFAAGLDTQTQLALVNKNIRRIARVIIEPRFRGIGLAARLVRETMPRMNVPVIEALAVMGLVNPFFAKAGMQQYAAKTPARCIRLIEALSFIGIEDSDLIHPRRAHDKITRLDAERGRFIDLEIGLFLQSYGSRRRMKPGPNRTKYALSRLTERPVYYIWFNPQMEIRI